MGVDMNDCIFCKIARGELHSYKIWENDDFVAFLSLYPETEGMTIVIPKEHIPSYFLEVDDEVVCELMIAAKEVARILDTKLDNVLRTKVVFEGLDYPLSVEPLPGIPSHERTGFTVTDWGGTIIGRSCTDITVK